MNFQCTVYNSDPTIFSLLLLNIWVFHIKYSGHLCFSILPCMLLTIMVSSLPKSQKKIQFDLYKQSLEYGQTPTGQPLKEKSLPHPTPVSRQLFGELYLSIRIIIFENCLHGFLSKLFLFPPGDYRGRDFHKSLLCFSAKCWQPSLSLQKKLP